MKFTRTVKRTFQGFRVSAAPFGTLRTASSSASGQTSGPAISIQHVVRIQIQLDPSLIERIHQKF